MLISAAMDRATRGASVIVPDDSHNSNARPQNGDFLSM